MVLKNLNYIWMVNRTLLAAGVAGGDPVFRLPAGGAQNHLHHKCD